MRSGLVSWVMRMVCVATAVGGGCLVPASASAGVGDLDLSFGTNGVTISQFAPGVLPVTDATDDVIAPNGDIYVAGSVVTAAGAGGSSPGATAVMLARYLPSGALDTTFASGGVSIKQVGQDPSPSTNFSGNGDAEYGPVVLTPSGDLIVPTVAAGPSGGAEPAIVAFNSSTGALDTSFGNSGTYYDDALSTSSPKNATATGAAVQSDGKVVITGNAHLADGTSEGFVQRLNTDGTLDTTFAAGDPAPSTAGTFVLPSTASVGMALIGVTVDSVGNIVIAGGESTTSPKSLEFLVESLNSSGQVNAGFPVTANPSPGTPPSASASAVMQAADGDYIVVGNGYSSTSVGFAALAVKPTGAIDTTFGGGGTGGVFLPTGGLFAFADSVVQQANGRIILDGEILAGLLSSGPGVADVGRLLPNGTPDPAFGSGGVVTIPVGQGAAFGAAIASDGQLIVSGQSVSGSKFSALLAKVTLDTPPSLAISVSPTQLFVGQQVNFAAGSVDDASTPTVQWDTGSGSFTGPTGPTGTTSFSTPGTYTLRARSTDDDGHSTVVTQAVTVMAPPPTITKTVTVPAPLPARDCTGSIRPTAALKSKLLLHGGLLLSGTAAAHCPRTVISTGVALARLNKHKQCSFLSMRHRWGKYGRCTPASYLPASGTYSWAFALKFTFAPGTYWVWERATDDKRASTTNAVARHVSLQVTK